MKKAQAFKIIGIILIAVGLWLLLNIFTDYRYLTILFRVFGMENAAEFAYKGRLLLDPLKPIVMLISLGMMFFGGYTVAKQQ